MQNIFFNSYDKSPLDQFEIRDLVSIDAQILNYTHLSITNIGLYLIISVFIILALNIFTKNENLIIPNA